MNLRVKYCPTNLQITFQWGPWNPDYKSNTYDHVSECEHVICYWPSKNFDICINDVVPDYFGFIENHPGNPELCKPRTMNLYQLYEWDFLGLIDEPGYSGSGLESFVRDHGFWEEAGCANVTYCQSDFRLVNSDFGQINCSFSTPPGGPIPCAIEDASDLNSNLKKVLCESYCPQCPSNGIGSFTYRYLDLEYKGLRRTNTNILNHFIDPVKGTTMGSWVEAKGDGTTYNKVIFDGPGNENYYYDFIFRNSHVPYKAIGNICEAAEDWDNNSTVWIECPIANSTTIHMDNESLSWGKEVHADNNLELLKLGIIGDNLYQCIFKSTGRVVFDNVEIFNGIDDAIHKVKFNLTGDVINVNTSTINGGLENIYFDVNDNYCRFLIDNNATEVLDNGILKNLEQGERAIISLCDDGEMNFFARLWTSSNMKIKDIAVSEEGHKTFVSLVGQGKIKINGSQVFNSANKYGVIIYLNERGDYIRKKVMGSTGIVDDQLMIAARENGTQYVAFTLDRQISLGGQTLAPSGGTDFVIAGLNNSGGWHDISIYGSAADESVTDIDMTTNHLFISGFASRGEYSRVVGDFEIYSSNNNIDFPFISAKLIPNGGSSQSTFSDTQEYDIDADDIEFSVYPALATDQVVITIKDHNQLLLSKGYVLNSRGETIKEINLNYDDSITSQLSVNVSNLPSGIYLVSFLHKNGQRYTKKFVKQ